MRFLQPSRGHRSGHDAVLLAATVAREAEGSLVELGSGVGVAGLIAAARAPRLSVTLVDIDEDLLALALENARRNGLVERVRAIRLDVAAPGAERARAGLGVESADLVILNPPFFRGGREQGSGDGGAQQRPSGDHRRPACPAPAHGLIVSSAICSPEWCSSTSNTPSRSAGKSNSAVSPAPTGPSMS